MTNQESGSKSSGEARARDLAQQAIHKAQLAHKWKSASGRDAWSEIHRAAYGDGKGGHSRKLTHDEAAVIASRLHSRLVDDQPQLKALGVSKTELCRKAFGDTDSKELYRLTLPPGTNSHKRSLRLDADKYIRLIETLAYYLGSSASVIGEPLLAGTRLTPLSRTENEFSELDAIHVALQHIVDDLDREFGLFETYRQTAKLKCKGVVEGDKCCWPLYTPYAMDEQELNYEKQDDYSKEYAIATDLNQAFIRRNHFYRTHMYSWFLYGFETGALQNDDFFYVPHAPLGHLLLWDLPDPKLNRAAYFQAVDEQVFKLKNANTDSLPIPKDEWNPEKKNPFGQTMQRGAPNEFLQDHFWLIAYPHPEGKRLVPTLYQPGGEGGAYLLPLDLEGLEMLADVVWVSPTSHCNALQRIQQLLADQDANGQNSIERGMRRTSVWLAENPILKKEAERQEVSRRVDGLARRR
ncbi:MAG: hypothetical protein Q7L55_09140 [Actinomycetota bacterium]|nr:hypothetical protein [Actinomycetota bacterium]